MPRLFDRIDAAVGRTPEVLDLGVDYATRQSPPETLISEGRTYNGGWYTAPPRHLNFDVTDAFDISFQTWYHFTIDTPTHYIVFNLADLSKVSNTALLIAEKASGRFDHGSLVRVTPQALLTISPDFDHYLDPANGSFVKLAADGGLAFSIHSEGLHLSGRAKPHLGPPWVQVTRFHRGRGSLQSYGNMALEFGNLTVGEQVISLPQGALCTFDHTLGHQRGIQNWNWVAAAGVAVCEESGQRRTLALQLARDLPKARPQVFGQKFILWTENEVVKFPDVLFEYEYTDESNKDTGPWHIHTPTDPEALDLTFNPRFHRRENKELVIATSDFNQYYGTLSGTISVEGKRYIVRDWFAVTEESYLEL